MSSLALLGVWRLTGPPFERERRLCTRVALVVAGTLAAEACGRLLRGLVRAHLAAPSGQ